MNDFCTYIYNTDHANNTRMYHCIFISVFIPIYPPVYLKYPKGHSKSSPTITLSLMHPLVNDDDNNNNNDNESFCGKFFLYVDLLE